MTPKKNKVNHTTIFLELVYQSVFSICNEKLCIRGWIEEKGGTVKSLYLVSFENDIFKEYSGHEKPIQFFYF